MHQRLRQLPTRARVVGISAVVAILAIVGVAAAVTVASGNTQQATPRRPSGLSDCRTAPLAHVHDPLRLDLLAPCVAVKGRIRSIRLYGGYNDVKVKVEVAGSYLRFLKPANRNVLVVDVVATDLATVLLPPVGSDATFYGAWVYDKATKAAMLHPVWRVVPTEPTAHVVPAGSAAQTVTPGARPLHEGQPLSIDVHRVAEVKVGNPLPVRVNAAWLKQQAPKSNGAAGQPQPSAGTTELEAPASQVRLFYEVTTKSGTGVRWRARTTNTQGTATARLLALFVPGRYQLTVYAYADGKTARDSSVFTVKGR